MSLFNKTTICKSATVLKRDTQQATAEGCFNNNWNVVITTGYQKHISQDKTTIVNLRNTFQTLQYIFAYYMKRGNIVLGDKICKSCKSKKVFTCFSIS